MTPACAAKPSADGATVPRGVEVVAMPPDPVNRVTGIDLTWW